MFSKLKCFHGFKSITHTFECKKDSFPSVGRRYMRISPKWYRRIGLLVPRGAEAWYRSYRSDGTGTKVPIYTLSKGAVRTVPQGTPR